uniref:Photolyase/cryptochrome alpha/beta domain-containing protein n=1 Tax=Globisporangium ultimum (strain ATCC 200006 / CBS 805.95 / DAOM BR144) TaxID=431595 RepID=K3WWY3_GLOUD
MISSTDESSARTHATVEFADPTGSVGNDAWSPSALEYLDNATMDVDDDAMYGLDPFDVAEDCEDEIKRSLRASESVFSISQYTENQQELQERVAAPMPRRRALVWFRRDLRLHDNKPLHAAMQALKHHELDELIPIYIIHRPVKKRCSAVRFQFLLECVADLSQNLESRNSALVVLRGEASEVFKVVFSAWGITDLLFEESVVPYALAQDNDVRAIASHFNVYVRSFHGQTLFDPRAVIALNGGVVPTEFSQFLKLTEALPQPSLPTPMPTSVPGWKFSKDQLYSALDTYCRTYLAFSGAVVAGPRSEPFAIPDLAAFGHSAPAVHSFLYGGESIALKMLDEFCANEERVGLFQKPKTSPACIEKPSTTALSAYVSFGCMSPREFFYRVMFIQLKFPGLQGPPPVTLDGQLMWREFFYCYAVGVPHFDTQEHNPLCKQINWKLQQVPSPDTVLNDETKVAMEQLQSWMTGRTGYPWIDAVMRQIEQEGWAHHVARHAVACFLTRGDLYISWLRGAYFFQEKLIDLDWALNIGNWLWVSSSCFFADYNAVHSPSMFIQQWDPQGKFIKKYIPALRKMPARYIFEPWKAPLGVQRTAECLIGKDYPFPIVDHTTASKKCVDGVSRAHQRAMTPLDAVGMAANGTSAPSVRPSSAPPMAAVHKTMVVHRWMTEKKSNGANG